jgi:phage recombination protein Bet
MNDLVVIDTSRGPVELSPDIIRRYFCPNATDQEVAIFIKLCVYQKLNPFLRQAHLVKYGTSPATMVVGWHVFLERAETNPYFDGYRVEVYDQHDQPYRGRQGQTISHATATVFRKDHKYPTEVTVLFKEYCLTNASGVPMASWGKIPSTMIRKVALEQALREAFTKDFVGMYGPEEMGVAEELPEEEIVTATVGELRNGDTIVVEEPDEPTPEEVMPLVAQAPPPVRKSTARHPAVIAPLTASKYLTDMYGVMWMKKLIGDKPVGEHYFGVKVMSYTEMTALAQSNKAAWETGVARILADAAARQDKEAHE